MRIVAARYAELQHETTMSPVRGTIKRTLADSASPRNNCLIMRARGTVEADYMFQKVRIFHTGSSTN